MNLVRRVAHTFDAVIDALRVLAIILIVWVWLSTCAEVFLRYFLNRPQAWTLELTEYSLLCITFLGTTWVLREEGHVKMDIVVRRLSPRRQGVVNVVASILCAVVCLVVAIYTGEAMWDHFQRATVTPKLLSFPFFPLLAIIAVGYGLLSIQFLRRAYGFLKNAKASQN